MFGAQRGLILDLDDTLYPRHRFINSGLAAVAQYVQQTRGLAAEDAYAVMRRANATGREGSELQQLCEHFELSPSLIPVFVDVMRTHRPTVFLSASARDTLERLRASRWSLAIVTNGLPSVQFRKIAALGLTALVDEVIYAEEHAAGGKPSAAPFRAALHSLDLTAEACITVGDDLERDIAGARRLGMRTVRIARPGAVPAARQDADAVIADLTQLPEAVEELWSTPNFQLPIPNTGPELVGSWGVGVGSCL